jgi:hypothetical protein
MVLFALEVVHRVDAYLREASIVQTFPDLEQLAQVHGYDGHLRFGIAFLLDQIFAQFHDEIGFVQIRFRVELFVQSLKLLVVDEEQVLVQANDVRVEFDRFVVHNGLFVEVAHELAYLGSHASLCAQRHLFYLVIQQTFEQGNVQFVFGGHLEHTGRRAKLHVIANQNQVLTILGQRAHNVRFEHFGCLFHNHNAWTNVPEDVVVPRRTCGCHGDDQRIVHYLSVHLHFQILE